MSTILVVCVADVLVVMFAHRTLPWVADRNIGPSGMGQDDPRLLKIASLVAKDLALLERRAKAEEFQV